MLYVELRWFVLYTFSQSNLKSEAFRWALIAQVWCMDIKPMLGVQMPTQVDAVPVMQT